MLIILTGPPGAGKSTTAELLAEKYPKSASFSIDTIRHFIKGGNIPPWETGKEAEDQMKLGDDVVKDIIRRYLNAKYVVVVDGVLGNKELKEFKELFGPTYGFLLLPSLEVLKHRDSLRPSTQQIPERIEPLYNSYISMENGQFEIIDNSQKSIGEVVDYIYYKINENNH